MKRIGLLVVALFFICSTASATQQTISSIPATTSATNLRNLINDRLTKTQANFVELYNDKADVSCFDSQANFNACFTLDWATGGEGGSMLYPAAGVPKSTGSTWDTSYTVGTSANNLVQLNALGQLPAVSGVNLTGLTYSQLSGIPTAVSLGWTDQVAFETWLGWAISGGVGAGITNLSVTPGASSFTIYSSTGNDATVNAATTIAAGAMTAADKTKLDGIAEQATKNQTDAYLLALGNHTGTLPSSAISDFAATVSTVMSSYITKLNGIATGAEVNVNADWNASSGDAQILNKPSVVATDVDFTVTATATFEDVILPKFDTLQFNALANEDDCVEGANFIYFYGGAYKQCLDGVDSAIGSGGSMTYPSSGNIAYTSNGTSWTAMGLDTDISSTSSNDDTVPSAKAVRTAIDAISASGVPSVTATPADAATGAVWYNSTARELCVAESAGISCVAMTYTADDNDPSNSTPWFTDETDIAINTAKVSNAITLAGLGARGAAISVTGSSGAGYSKNSAACTATAGRGYNNDTVAACVTSSASNSTETTATITVGTDSDQYSVTTVASSSGFVGTRNATLTNRGYGGSNGYTFMSAFTATGGDVSYFYFRRVASNLDMGSVKPVLYNSSLQKVVEAGSCTWTDVGGGLFRIAASSTVTLTNGATYYLGYANTDGDYQYGTSGEAGSIIYDTTLNGVGCATAQSTVTNDGTLSSGGAMPIWMSNDGGES